MKIAALLGLIGAASEPALRIAFTIAVLGIMAAGMFIYRWRHLLVGAEDVPVAPHKRLEEVIVVWGVMMLILLIIVYQLRFH